MDELFNRQRWPALEKDDAGLLKELHELLTRRCSGNPYSSEGTFAASISPFPSGLRAMAATHWLDVSLAIDSMTWHFGNFGEPRLTAETEAGLRELGLNELAACFAEARELMVPLLAHRTAADDDSDEILERAGLAFRAEELNVRACELGRAGPGKAAIYEAWIRYARQHPERVFGP